MRCLRHRGALGQGPLAAPVTAEYLWACDIDGTVDYNAKTKTKTYRFVLLDKYEVPYREQTDLKCTVHVQGEMTSSPAASKTRK